jgi:pyruvate formate lyase activating enzyme
MSDLQIKGFIETSLCDWDGCISSVIFLPGCNFRCPFCQNRDLVLAPEQLPSVPFESIVACLENRRSWIDGVVLTGGEPTIWPGLKDLARALKQLGFGVKLDTNGSRPSAISDLLDGGLVDYVAMDIKAPLDQTYRQAAGTEVDLGSIKRSIEIISAWGSYEFRTTLVPGLVGEDQIESIARAIGGAKRYALQRFVPENSLDKRLRGTIPYDDGFVSRLVEIAGRHVQECFYRGRTGLGLS